MHATEKISIVPHNHWHINMRSRPQQGSGFSESSVSESGSCGKDSNEPRRKSSQDGLYYSTTVRYTYTIMYIPGIYL